MTDEQRTIDEPRRLTFKISQVLEFMFVVGLWCVAMTIGRNVQLAIGYAAVTLTASWVVVSRWAVGLPEIACRRALAATTTLLVAGGAGLSLLVNNQDYYPFVWFLTVLPSVFVTAPRQTLLPPWLAQIIVNLVLALFVYSFWLLFFRFWDRLYRQPERRTKAHTVTQVLTLLLTLPVLLSVLSGCYLLHAHGDKRIYSHTWAHCVTHLAFLLTGWGMVALLHMCKRQALTLSPDQIKILSWGYFAGYATMLQVALFPFEFYIP